MKKRTWNYASAVLVLAGLSELYFFWQPFPKGFVGLATGQRALICDVLTNLIFFLLQYSVWLGIVSELTGEKMSIKQRLPFYGKFFVIQLFFDFVQIVVCPHSAALAPMVSDLCLALNWLLVTFILDKYMQGKLPRRESRLLRRILTGLVLLGFVAVIVFNLRDINLTKLLRLKYTPESTVLADHLMNMEFRQQRRSVHWDELLAALAAAWLYFGFAKEEQNDDPRLIRHIGMLVLRGFLLASAIAILLVVKLAVLPQSLLFDFGIAVDGLMTQKTSGVLSPEGRFNTQNRVFTMARMADTLKGETSLVYARTTSSVIFDGVIIYSFQYDGAYSVYSMYAPQPLESDIRYNLRRYELQSASSTTKAATIAGEELAWYEDGQIQHISLNKLKRAKENENLTEFCVELIRDDRWEFFEACSRYLLKQAPEKIRPLLRVYAESTSLRLTQWKNRDIRWEYVQETAKALLSEIDRTPPRPAEDRRASDGSSLPDKSVLYKQLISPERERSDELEFSVMLKDREASFYPREGAESAESQNLLPAEIYSKSVTVDLEKGGKLILGCDSDESSPILYLNPRVVKEDDPEGTQYGFFMPYGFEYMFSNPPKYGYPISVFLRLDDFHSLEVYDAKGEPLAQYDNHTKQFVMFPDKEWESMPGTNFFINNRSYDFIPCDGGVRFGPCYFHHAEDSEPLPIPPEKGGVLCFQTQMAIVRLSDGEVLDNVFIFLKEVEFNKFEIVAASQTELVPVK